MRMSSIESPIVLNALDDEDKIIVTAGAPHIPTNYVKQLKTGGAIVIPVGKTQASQKMILAIKQADGSIKHEVKGDFKFVPLLGEQGWKTWF